MTPEESMRGVIGLMQGVTCPACQEHVEVRNTRECECGVLACVNCAESHTNEEGHKLLPEDD